MRSVIHSQITGVFRSCSCSPGQTDLLKRHGVLAGKSLCFVAFCKPVIQKSKV